MENAKAEFLFEVSWEVCNKVGGIHTVVKSKVMPILDHYKEKYFVVGPYHVNKVSGEFTELLPPPQLKSVFQRLSKEGIFCHFGSWVVKGEPKTILIDYSNFQNQNNRIKTELWENYKIDSLNSDFHDFDEPVVWAYAVGRLLEEIAKLGEDKIVAQFHEWLSGAALLYLKSRKVKIGTVFTTHATMLGRTMTGRNIELYKVMDKIDSDKEAYELGVHPKHQMETQCAKHADVFTTVSEITGIEAEALLKRKPDVLLPNGLDLGKFPTTEELTIRHRQLREKMKEFMMYYFFPYYKFNLDKTLIFFIAGRYEYHDKGIDLFIDALGQLNKKLIEEKNPHTVVAFFWVPANFRGIKAELLENKTVFNDIKDSVGDSIKEIGERILYGITSQKSFSSEFLFGEEGMHELKKKVMKLMRNKDSRPSLSTHNLHDEGNDDMMNGFKHHKLLNSKDDKVKVVLYPIYLTGADQLLDLDYYEAMTGSHMGVFPSYYEPWGYTPLEAGALGVASITTDCAGFGRYIKGKGGVTPYPGIFILDRLGKPDNQAAGELAEIFHNYCKLTKQERIENKIQARRIASLADWKLLIGNYIRAHNLAVEKTWS